MGRPRTTEATFWSRVERAGPDECWPWTGGTRDGHYGSFKMGGVHGRTHRWAWSFTNGPIPDGMHVLHSCDRPLCCNPAHLHLGTHADNMRERTERGRNKPRTRASGSTKLTPEQADDIRQRWAGGRTTGALAAEYGVSGQMVWRLGTGRDVQASHSCQTRSGT